MSGPSWRPTMTDAVEPEPALSVTDAVAESPLPSCESAWASALPVIAPMPSTPMPGAKREPLIDVTLTLIVAFAPAAVIDDGTFHEYCACPNDGSQVAPPVDA